MATKFAAFAVAALVALFSFASAHDIDPYDFCEVKCVKRIYRDYCGGVPCVFGATGDEEKNALCSKTCINALVGDVMFQCLMETDSERKDFELVVDTFLQEIMSFCEHVTGTETPSPEVLPYVEDLDDEHLGVDDVDDLPDEG